VTKLSERDARFVEQRRTLSRRWRFAGWFLCAAIAAVLGFLFLKSPLLVAPWEVVARLRTESLPLTTLQTMALMLPITFLGCFVLLVAVVAFQFAAFANEQRLIDVIDTLQGSTRED
jgi:hypothetical protein